MPPTAASGQPGDRYYCPGCARVFASFSPDSGVVGDGITNATVLAKLIGAAEADRVSKSINSAALLGSASLNGSGGYDTTRTLADTAHTASGCNGNDTTGNVPVQRQMPWPSRLIP